MYNVRTAANHKVILPKNNKNSISFSPSLNISTAKETICMVVLNFAILETGTLTFIPAKNSLNPDTIISLKRIMSAGIVNQLCIVPIAVSTNITDETNSLSAIGSKKYQNLFLLF